MAEQEKKRIELNVEGFATKPEYLFNLPALMNQYEDKFVGADKIKVKIVGKIGEIRTDIPLHISENGELVVINILFTRFVTNKGKLSDFPTPSDFYEHVIFVMDQAVNEYSGRFNK